MTSTGPGYHLTNISKGKLGEISKIREELEELVDAEAQGVRIMALVEMSDLIGALRAYLSQHYPGFTLMDLEQMSFVTERAFVNGHRS